LLQAREKLGMGHSELLHEIIFFLLAGSHTSVHALTHVLDEMFAWFDANPEDRARPAADPFFIQRCVHEALRLYPSSPIAKRRPDCPMNIPPIGEVGAGDDVVIHLDQANRDEDAFGADAGSFCPHRAADGRISPYGLSMGIGMHTCLGLNLAVGAVPKAGADPATHHFGTVPMIVSALVAAGVRPHPGQAAIRDETTTRATWSRFPVAFVRPEPAVQPASFDKAKAVRKPATAISPAKSRVPSNASGTIVSTIMARIAPAATACTAATQPGETPAKAT
jgi:hypothetical protein